MAQDMIVGLKNASMTPENFVKILSYFKLACEQLSIVDQATDILLNSLYDLKDEICCQMARTESILDKLDSTNQFERLTEQLFIDISRNSDLKRLGAY